MIIRFGERLKELRLEKEMTQAQVGKILNVSARTAGRWESEEIQPDYLTLATLAKFFDVSTDYLLGLED